MPSNNFWRARFTNKFWTVDASKLYAGVSENFNLPIGVSFTELFHPPRKGDFFLTSRSRGEGTINTVMSEMIYVPAVIEAPEDFPHDHPRIILKKEPWLDQAREYYRVRRIEEAIPAGWRFESFRNPTENDSFMFDRFQIIEATTTSLLPVGRRLIISRVSRPQFIFEVDSTCRDLQAGEMGVDYMQSATCPRLVFRGRAYPLRMKEYKP